MGRFLTDLLDKVEKYVADDTDTEVVVDKHGLRAKILLTHMFRTSTYVNASTHVFMKA